MGSKTIRVSGFPINVTATEAKTFLESKTGAGTIYALKIRNPDIINNVLELMQWCK
ncbi:hypothetical protein QJS10_CPB22g00391 [Acorus calamus]|uniref:RDR1/2-like RRM domain-containing protein n=1 Tax=Acorus calamus TaxID=4465 RepID=A0AAV9C0B4_ACOCL|nr:hypothetical protein QJS10_CPB22g00391 [Acorus calamus]